MRGGRRFAPLGDRYTGCAGLRLWGLGDGDAGAERRERGCDVREMVLILFVTAVYLCYLSTRYVAAETIRTPEHQNSEDHC